MWRALFISFGSTVRYEIMGFQLVVFDLDGVLVEEPSAWWTLHHAFGTYEASKENLYAYERSIIDYPEFMRRDINLWGLRNIKEIKDILLKFTLREDAIQTCDNLRDQGYRLAIVSAGIDILAEAVSARVSIQNWVANGLLLDEKGLLKGEGIFRVDLKRKDWALTELLNSLRVELPEVVAVGDSKYDLSMMEVCGGGIAFTDARATEGSLVWTKGWCKVPALSALPEALTKLIHP